MGCNRLRPPRGSKEELPPIFEVYLVGFVDEENVSFASSYLLRLVDANKLNHIPPQLIGCIALVVEVGVVYLFLVEYLEEVPHRCRSKCWECLSAYGDNETRVLMTKLNEYREDGVRLSGSCPALVNLDFRLAFFDVVICRG